MKCKFCRHPLTDNYIKTNGEIYCNALCMLKHRELKAHVALWLSLPNPYSPLDLDVIPAMPPQDWRD